MIDRMKIIVDEKIPYIREALANIADEVVYTPGKDFTPELVKDADALIIRTRTQCDRRLLEGSRVRFIATATIGFDHIDTEYCRRAGITWQNAPGCNSASVAQYLQSSLLLLQQEKGFRLEDMTLGVVGVGNVGSKVAQVGRDLGMKVLLNDPPREEKEGNTTFSPLERLLEECDVLTLHVPLVREGKHPTYHLVNREILTRLKHRAVLVNTSRGEVIETQALLDALNKGRIADAIIDVWENEPDINRELLGKVFIGTPHIAGYSADGKANASRMSVENICRFFGLKAACRIEPPVPPCTVIRADGMKDALLQIYDPREDCKRLRAEPEQFERLRGSYPLRREKEAYTFVLGQ